MELVVTDSIRVQGADDGTLASSIAVQGSEGEGGQLDIETDTLEVFDGGTVSTSALGTGNAGDLRIDARQVFVSGSEEGGSGVPAEIGAEAIFGSGNAGDVVLVEPELVEIRAGGSLGAEVRTASGGLGGTVRIESPGSVDVDGGLIDVISRGPKQAGDVLITDADNVQVRNGGEITAESFFGGGAGRIEISGSTVEVSSGEISARENSNGSAGTIDITSTDGLLVTAGTITSEVNNGPGGAITLIGRR
jgi:hypothetical protein